jgi:hypothetical protein
MADNKVLFTLEIQQKGSSVSAVVKETDKLAKSTRNVERADRKRNKTSSTTYNRQKQGIIQTANSTKNFSKLSQSIDGGGGGPGGLVRAYALLAANVFALSAAFNVFSRAAQVDTLVESMRQLEVVSGKSIMSVARDLQEATGYGMNFAESMRATSLALSAGFDSSQVSALGEVARNAAVSLGRNLPDALDRIFRGVIKVEPELLDEIGLFVRVNDASAKYASTIGKSVGDLTEFEKRQAFLNEALDQGTQKFAAFAEVENDPFALLATTFADISQAVLSFLNNAIGPAVKFLAENKMIFSIIFGAVAYTLLKMAIPAMGAFTNSMALNAATAKEASDKQIRANKARAEESRKSHKAFLAQEIEKKKALAATARAQTMKGPQAKLDVRGKVKIREGGEEKMVSASRRLEKALKKEISGKGRLELINQRILDLTKKQGLEKRKQMPGYDEELNNLRQEAALEQEILDIQLQMNNVADRSGFAKGKLQDLQTIKLTKAAFISEGVAKVTNTAQTYGLKAAYDHLNTELLETEAALLKEGITMTWLDKVMFKLKAGTASLAVGFQALMMTVMPWITGFLMLLPLLKMVAKWMGFGNKEAGVLKEKYKAAAEAIDLLDDRVKHLNKQFDKQGKSAKDYNIGMEAYNETLLSTVNAMREQADAYVAWQESTNWVVRFFSETLPSVVGFGTENAMRKQREKLLDGLDRIKYDLSPKMQELKEVADSEQFWVNVQRWLLSPLPGATFSFTDTIDELEAIEKQIRKETEATNNFRSAVNGLTDSARAFSDSFIVSTDFDKPLASLNQVISTMNAVDPDDGSKIITEKQRLSYAQELTDNGAIRAILSQEENLALKESVGNADRFEKLLGKVRDRFFQMQELTIRMKSNMADMVDLQKQMGKFAKMSGTAATEQLAIEKDITALKIKQLQMNVDNTKSQTNLTEEQLREFATMDSLLPLVEDEVLKKEDLKSVMSAIHNLRILDNMVLEQQIENATRLTRQELARAEVAMTNLDLEEKINKEKISQLKIQNRIDKFAATGNLELTTAEKLDEARKIANIELKTVDRKYKLELAISDAKFKILSIEAQMMKDKAAEEKKKMLKEKARLEAIMRKTNLSWTNILGFAKSTTKDLTESEKTFYENVFENIDQLDSTINSYGEIVNEIGNQSVLTADLITEKFKTGAKDFLDKIMGFLSEGLPGVTEDQMASTFRNQQTIKSGYAGIDEDLTTANMRLGEDTTLSPEQKEEQGRANILEAEALKTQTAINLMETNLLQFADNITNVFGEDGVFVSALATASANILDLGQNFGAEFDKAETTAGKVAVATGAAASAIGNMISLSAAQAKQQTGEIDKLIEAEEKRDGKSAQSVAKIKALEAKKEAIKRKAFETNKKMMLAQAVMSTAAGIAAAMAGPPGPPWSYAFVAAAAAMGAMQINLIKGMTYSGGASSEPTANTALSIGGRGNKVDVSKQVGGGELAYLRNQQGVGTNANDFRPSGAVGMKNYSTGMPIMVGEQGPEIITPPVDIIPNEDISRGGTTNINFSISAVDGQSVQNMLQDQQGNIISMIREAANDNGEFFLENVDSDVYGSASTGGG